MSSAYEGPDALRVYLTGATLDAGLQGIPANSLGGKRAFSLADSLTVRRYNPIAGIVIDMVASACGSGLGTITADTASSLVWTPPGHSSGASVAIENGETKILQGPSGYEYLYIVVSRSTASALAGSETVQLFDTYGTVCAASDFSSAERTAGSAHSVAVAFYAHGAITGLTVWIDSTYSGHTRIAKEAPSSNAIQTIANQSAAPSGVSWSTATAEGSGVVIGDIAAGSWHGLWIEQSVSAGAAASARIYDVVRYSYTAGATKHYGELRGLHRVADAALNRIEIFTGIDADPDLSGTPVATAPITAWVDGKPVFSPFTVALAAGHTYRIGKVARNAYGLASLVKEFETVVVNANATQGKPAPSAPSYVESKAGPLGKALVMAAYDPSEDDSRATEWLVYERTNGTDPVPGVDTPTVIAMGTSGDQEILAYESASEIDMTPFRHLVRTRRTDDGVAVDSANTSSVSVTGAYDGPLNPIGSVTLGRSVGVHQTANAFDGSGVVYIDQAKNIRWVMASGSASLYFGSVLAWRAMCLGFGNPNTYLFIPNDWDTYNGAVSGAGSANPVEVASTTLAYIVTRDGIRRMSIDASAKRITYNAYDQEAIRESRQSSPAWQRYDAACFQIFDPMNGRWTTYASVDTAGTWQMSVPYDQRFTQAQIEAL